MASSFAPMRNVTAVVVVIGAFVCLFGALVLQVHLFVTGTTYEKLMYLAGANSIGESLSG